MKIVKILALVIVVLVGLILLVSIIGGVNFKRSVKAEVIDMFKNSRAQKSAPITEADLEGLPVPVQKYLRYCGIVGKERISNVSLKMKGQFKQERFGDFLPMEADEYYTVDPPAFNWLGTVQANPLFHIRARDRYLAGKGNMLIKLLSTFTVADALGKEMNEASLMRYLNEMMWFPTAYLNENVTWEAIDDKSAKVSLTDSGITVTATAFFNEAGQMIDFVAPRYYAITGTMETWSTPITDYKEVYGIHIPSKGEGVWKLADGDFCYIKLELTDIEYNAGPPTQ